jgi:pyruvate dehydrogenase phosphatase
VSNSGVLGKKHKLSEEKHGNWIFKDENVAAHLIRNAFAGPGDDNLALNRILSIPAPLARRFRDDTSVIVIWWDESKEPQAKL